MAIPRSQQKMRVANGMLKKVEEPPWSRLSQRANELLVHLNRDVRKRTKELKKRIPGFSPPKPPRRDIREWNKTLETIRRHLEAIIRVSANQKFSGDFTAFPRNFDDLRDPAKNEFNDKLTAFWSETNEHLKKTRFRANAQFRLEPDFRVLLPDRLPSEYLWGLAVFLIQDIARGPGRLKQCTHVQDGKPCARFFWDRSKNRRARFCNDKLDLKVRNRERVRRWRETHKGVHHGTTSR